MNPRPIACRQLENGHVVRIFINPNDQEYVKVENLRQGINQVGRPLVMFDFTWEGKTQTYVTTEHTYLLCQ